MRIVGSFCFLFVVLISVSGQSARAKRYSESRATTQKTATNPSAESSPGDENVIKVETDLVIVPFRVTNKRGLAITDIAQHEVRVFESGEEREIAFFANIDQPFTVALVLDVSYSTVFKLKAIQDAAKKFVSHLRADDRVMVVTFSERPMVMCEPTGDRRVLDIAIYDAGHGAERKAVGHIGPKGRSAADGRC
jgi:VWFA-related protein